MRNPRTEKGPNSKLGWNSRDTVATNRLPAFFAREGKWLNVGCVPLFHPQRRRVFRVSMRASAFTQPHLPGGIGLKAELAVGLASTRMVPPLLRDRTMRSSRRLPFERLSL